jgi:hypothetical protein
MQNTDVITLSQAEAYALLYPIDRRYVGSNREILRSAQARLEQQLLSLLPV